MNNVHCTENSVVVKCPICSCTNSQLLFRAASWESFARDQIYDIRYCHECHITFTNPTESSESLNKFYSQGLYRDTHNRFYMLIEGVQWIFQWSRLRKIKRACKQGKLLDVGCGKGRFLAYAALNGWDVFGVEPSENSRSIARSRLGDRVVGSLKELPPDRFDVIVLWHVLEHVLNPVEMLRQLHQYMKPGGILCVAVPNFSSLQARLGKSRWSHLDVPRHVFHFTPETLKYVLESADYTVLHIDHFSVEFNPIGVLQTVLNCLGLEPGFIYAVVKRNASWGVATSKLRFLYSAIVATVGIPFLILPAFLFAYIESLFGKGGTILVYATPIELEQ